MDDAQRRELIQVLTKGEEISPEWARIIFPPEKREYELVYAGKEREEDVLANTLAVPLQKVRTFGGRSDGWENKLIFGDNLQVMKSLLEMKKAGRLRNADGSHGVRVVYIDPPFSTRHDFQGSAEQKAYQDKIAGAQFLEFLRRRLIVLRELLSEDGTIYIHLDWRKVHYVKVLCDEIFSEKRFRNEAIWFYRRWSAGSEQFQRQHETLLVYSKGSKPLFNVLYEPYTEGTLKRWKGIKRTTTIGDDGRLIQVQDTSGTEGANMGDVWPISIINANAVERTGYPTQKPEELVKRPILASSNEGDIVLDVFAGSGTTAAVAEKLKRRWIAVDCGKFSIYTIQKRLLSLRKEIGNKGVELKPKAFSLYNAGLYDFSKLKELPWEAWRFFSLQLFQCKDSPHTIGGIKLDGYLKGSSVLVFNHQEQRAARIDEDTIQSLHEGLGSKVGDRMFIIAPALTFDFQQDYITLDGVRYYALRIPYSIIHELHQRDFAALRQPIGPLDVNDTVDAVGFDFIRSPDLAYDLSIDEKSWQGVIHIKKFKSEALVGNGYSANRESLSMVMVDLDFDAEQDVFRFDSIYYAEDIESAGWKVKFPWGSVGKSLMVIFVDVFGNEARELIPHSAFKKPKGGSNVQKKIPRIKTQMKNAARTSTTSKKVTKGRKSR